jgi:glycosyltransferase involved in cell wall biosynthesis
LAAAVKGIARVLHVQTDSGLSGGVARYISTLVDGPALQAFEHLVVSAGAASAPAAAKALYGGRTTVSLPPSYGVFSLPGYRQRLQQLVREHGIDLIHAHALRAASAASVVAHGVGVPMVYTNHGLRFTQKQGLAGKAVFRWMERRTCARAHRVVCIRPFDASRLAALGLVESRKLCTVTTRIAAGAPPKARRSHPPLLLGIGSLIEVKRPDRFIEWVGALRELGLEFDAAWLGDGPLRTRCEAKAVSRSARIRWLGHLPSGQVEQWLGKAQLLLLSSQFEVFPLAVLEAYARGVPVVSGHFDGVEDFLVAGTTGEIVNPDDAPAVARRVLALLSDATHWSRLSEGARAHFTRNFEDPNEMAREYAEIYSEALRQPRVAP